MNRTLKAIAIGAITAIAGIGVGAIGTEIASAHANQISGVSACQTDGTYTVTWKVANDVEIPESVQIVSSTPVGSTLSALPPTIAASPHANDPSTYSFATVTQSGIPGTAKVATLTVNGSWSDEYSAPNSGSVTLAGTCKPTTIPVTPVAPTVVTTTACGVKDTFSTNGPTGVIYTPSSGSLNAGQSVTVTATASAGYVIASGAQTSFTVTGGTIEVCPIPVTPVAPTVVTTTTCGVKDTFSTNGPTGVIYTPSSGSLNAGQTITVVATPASGYSFTPEAQTSFMITGGTVEVCTTDTTAPATTTTVPATTTTVPETTTTVPAIVVDAPTTTTTAAPAPTTTQVAQIDAPVPVTAAPLAVGDVLAPGAPVTGLPSTGTSSTLVLLLGGLLLAAGTGMLAVVRRRALK